MTHQRVVQRITNQGYCGSRQGEITPQPTRAQPWPGRQWSVHQVRAAELAGVTGDDTIVLQGPVRTDGVRYILEPDPAGSIRVFDDVETTRRCQTARKVIQPSDW